MSIYKLRRWLAYPCLFVVFAAVSIGVLMDAAQPRPVSVTPVAQTHLDAPALFKAYCAGCHDTGRTRIDLDEKPSRASVHQAPPLWRKVIRALRSEQMPPKDIPVNPRDRSRMIAWVEDTLRSMEKAQVAARRIATLEYRNALRDLLGVEVRLSSNSIEDDCDMEPIGQVVLPSDFPADEPYWTLHPVEPMIPAEMQAAYQAAATAAVAQWQDQSRMKRMSLAERRRELENLATRAFSRPPSPEERERWQRLIENDYGLEKASNSGNGSTFALTGFKAALQEVLTSPRFLYKIEQRPDRDAPQSRTQYELASRLACFLWTSVPDDGLLTEAQHGTLTTNLEHQVARMLMDRRAENLARQFTNHWLQLGELDTLEFLADSLRNAMRAETERFVAHNLQENRDIRELLNADYTFVDETLAKHYGIEGVHGTQFRLVHLAHSERRGLLGQASILSLTSRGEETSPMRRGRWILENLLGERVPPPPLDVIRIKDAPMHAPGGVAPETELFDAAEASAPARVQQLLNRRRENFQCGAYCHAPIAGLGASLENFSSAGTWRIEQFYTADGATYRIDSTGASPTGALLAGPQGLNSYLMGRQKEFLSCFSGKLLAYGLGRKARDSDQMALDEIVQRLGEDDWRFVRVVQQVAASRPFQSGFVERWPGLPSAIP